MNSSGSPDVEVHQWLLDQLSDEALTQCKQFASESGLAGTHGTPEIIAALCNGFGHRGYLLEASRAGSTVGLLPLVYMKTLLFGKLLVSLPYLNWGGVVASDQEVATKLVDQAIDLADALGVRFLELRHEGAIEHPKLKTVPSDKCQMRMPLTADSEDSWKRCRSTVRTQVRKGNKQGFELAFGRHELIDAYYHVFSTNMRDLGTPVYSKKLFLAFLDDLGSRAELCVVRLRGEAIACALAFHHEYGITEIPSASALRAFRNTAVNTWMYWQLIQRAIERGASTFDFGRSTPGGPTFDFKRKWGATDTPVAWQCYAREGDSQQVRPENSKYNTAIRLWQKLPLWMANTAGPSIVRGIP
ncbi:FemAB family XrtA/PEP-CTERM system-associated protein [Roseiconus lacunae]|uniref:FemAB family PEP-CTERM system-associated protein n=1 Tax=Roseiconus lacunae TaxID=2605694 RepID=A0ABT7PQQ1_9BACT|nr:FemAB family XrtA/PEP-CTERM system-associated protein [Roseiconus lacunae]MDM4018835.1 FemAB family PEP-CTERM system-associated protein [Roseiconus lacunae]